VEGHPSFRTERVDLGVASYPGSVNGGGEKKGKIIWDKYEKYEG